MNEINAELVKKLREETLAGIMDCKKALAEAHGDFQKAKEILREWGVAKASKRAGKVTKQGIIASGTKQDGKIVSLVEVNCETDFVARNQSFKEFVRKMAEKALETDGLLSEDKLIQDLLAQKIAEIGENIVIRRNIRYILQGKGLIQPYIHLEGKVGVLVEVGCTEDSTIQNPIFIELCKDIAMQIAAMVPVYISKENVPAEIIAKEKEIIAKQIKNKPANVIEKIVEGKMKQFYEENCLLYQPFIKEQKVSVGNVIDQISKNIKDNIFVRRFIRYQLGT